MEPKVSHQRIAALMFGVLPNGLKTMHGCSRRRTGPSPRLRTPSVLALGGRSQRNLADAANSIPGDDPSEVAENVNPHLISIGPTGLPFWDVRPISKAVSAETKCAG